MAASRRAVASTLRRAALSSVPRTARPLFAAAPRWQNPRLSATAAPSTTVGVRWYSAGESSPNSKIWSFQEIKAAINKPPTVIVDVREPHELFETGKIPGAINIPITSAVQSFHIDPEDFEAMYGFERPPRDVPLVFYCKAGVRARAAAGLAAHAGYESVGEYPGSWLEWESEQGPVEKVVKGDGSSGNH